MEIQIARRLLLFITLLCAPIDRAASDNPPTHSFTLPPVAHKPLMGVHSRHRAMHTRWSSGDRRMVGGMVGRFEVAHSCG